jgi:glycosyltransferase involved in cell wall biosynthesis
MLAAVGKVATRIAHFRTSADDHVANTVRRRVQRLAFRKLIDLYATDILGVGAGVLDQAWQADWAADSRCQVIYNGIPESRLRGIPATRGAGRRIINVASIQPRKNQLRLLEIFELCVKSQPDISLAFVGRTSGGYAETLRDEIRRRNLGHCVEMAGEVAEPIELIRSSDLLVLPSLWEGVPGAALEASAIGVPALTSDLPGTRELARFFPSVRCLSLDESNEVWAAAVSEMLASSASFREDAAARYLETPFSLETSRDQYYRVWERGGTGNQPRAVPGPAISGSVA